MTRKQLRKNVMEMVKIDKEFIKEKLEKAIASGAFEIKDYGNNFELPKLVLHAIYKELLFQRKPLFTDNMKESINLGCFL